MNMSAQEVAREYTKPRQTKARKAELVAYAEAKADTSKRVRWSHLLKDLKANDVTRLQARASGDWSAVNAQRAEAEPEAPAKPKSKPAAKRKPAAAKPEAQPALDPNALVAQLAGLDDAQFAAFFNALASARKK